MQETDAVDKWAAWLLHHRDADDAEQHAKAMEHPAPIRQRVLDNARISPGDTVLDVGAWRPFASTPNMVAYRGHSFMSHWVPRVRS